MAELNEVQQAVLDGIESGRRGYVKRDDYAGQRCACGHLMYDSDSRCRFCDCAGHHRPGEVTS